MTKKKTTCNPCVFVYETTDYETLDHVLRCRNCHGERRVTMRKKKSRLGVYPRDKGAT